jgi:hypothetical protein
MIREDGILEEIEEGATGLAAEDVGSDGEISDPFDPSLIRVESRTMTISLLLSRIEHNAIDLAPDFQRKGGIWSDAAQSRLIESLLIRIPLPAFYMDGTDDEKWLVVDGLQRLTSMKRFIIDKELRLSGLEFLRKYDKSNYDELPRNLQRRIQETQVIVFVIQEKTPPDVKFKIFKRINTGGLPLSSQEIRHALNQGPVTQFLRELAESKEFLDATDHGIRDNRMGDRECVLRFVAFVLTPPGDYPANGELDPFLSQTMGTLNSRSDLFPELRQRFLLAMVRAELLFGNKAFRKVSPLTYWRGPLNKALFEAWAVNLDTLDDACFARLLERKAELLDAFITLVQQQQDFLSAISQGTGDASKVRLRFSLVRRLIEGVAGC